MLTKELYLTVIAGRDGHDPCMKFHASLVALFDGKGQWVVSGIPSRASGQGFGEGLDGRRINQVATEACLKDDGVEVGFFQLVEDLA